MMKSVVKPCYISISVISSAVEKLTNKLWHLNITNSTVNILSPDVRIEEVLVENSEITNTTLEIFNGIFNNVLFNEINLMNVYNDIVLNNCAIFSIQSLSMTINRGSRLTIRNSVLHRVHTAALFVSGILTLENVTIAKADVGSICLTKTARVSLHNVTFYSRIDKMLSRDTNGTYSVQGQKEIGKDFIRIHNFEIMQEKSHSVIVQSEQPSKILCTEITDFITTLPNYKPTDNSVIDDSTTKQNANDKSEILGPIIFLDAIYDDESEVAGPIKTADPYPKSDHNHRVWDTLSIVVGFSVSCLILGGVFCSIIK